MSAIPWPTELVSLNISTVLRGTPLLRRASVAADAGYATIESWWPFGANDLDPVVVDAFVGSVADSGLGVAAFNLPSGDGRIGERGLPAAQDGLKRLRESVPAALDIAARLGCPTVNLLYGNSESSVTRLAQFDRGAEAVAWVVEAAAERGIRVMVEPLCVRDAPGYLLRSVDDARRLSERVSELASAPLGLCLDVYHLYQEDRESLERISDFVDLIAHVQVADFPGRAIPGVGEIDITSVLQRLGTAGYCGYVGLEYFAV